MKEDSVVYHNGLRKGDVVKGHVVANDSIDPTKIKFYSGNYKACSNKLKNGIDQANKGKLTLVLFIRRLS